MKTLNNNDFKEWFKKAKDTSGVEVRRNFGHLTSEELWEGASPALEAKNPATGHWVEIYPIAQ